jgi:hypothetical protein
LICKYFFDIFIFCGNFLKIKYFFLNCLKFICGWSRQMNCISGIIFEHSNEKWNKEYASSSTPSGITKQAPFSLIVDLALRRHQTPIFWLLNTLKIRNIELFCLSKGIHLAWLNFLLFKDFEFSLKVFQILSHLHYLLLFISKLFNQLHFLSSIIL